MGTAEFRAKLREEEPKCCLAIAKAVITARQGPQPAPPFTHQPVPTGAFERALALNANAILNVSEFTLELTLPLW